MSVPFAALSTVPTVSRSIPTRTYKGFDVGIVPRDGVHFGYEIQCRGSSPICSPGSYVTAHAAFAAACAFVDEVDRRVGLDPIDAPLERPREGSAGV